MGMMTKVGRSEGIYIIIWLQGVHLYLENGDRIAIHIQRLRTLPCTEPGPCPVVVDVFVRTNRPRMHWLLHANDTPNRSIGKECVVVRECVVRESWVGISWESIKRMCQLRKSECIDCFMQSTHLNVSTERVNMSTLKIHSSSWIREWQRVMTAYRI